MQSRNARAEAQLTVGDAYQARVLEPSPPTVDEAPWFADDPVAARDPADGRPVVSPVSNGDLTWDDWLSGHPEHSAWAAERWLGARRRLGAMPPTLTPTRLGLHRLAVYVLAPARRRANGKIGLRWTCGGFGTPFFGANEQVRVAGTQLVRQSGAGAAAEPITSLSHAAAFVLDGPPDQTWAEGFDVPALGDPEEAVEMDAQAAGFLGDWLGFAWAVLEELRAQPDSADPSRVQLWPEHFDAAFDCLGPEVRATFGASPGDHAVPEPYLYVLSVAVAGPPSDLWNATSFRGAILPYRQLVDAYDQRRAALDFFATRRAALSP